MLRNRLAYLGILPFVIFIALEFLSKTFLDASGDELFRFYSIIIANFMAGTLWHTQQKVLNVSLAIWSNVFCLSTFLAFFISTEMALALLALVYLAILITELAADLKQKLLSSYYVRMRINVTTIVILLHVLQLIF